MRTYTVAILGVTGAVGQEMLQVLQERQFPVGKLVALASGRSVGNTVTFRDQQIPIQEAVPEAFEGVDIVLGAAENDIAKAMAPHIRAAGAVFIDNSSAFRMDQDVPLVVPEVNGEDVKAHHGIISNPNCTTAISLTAMQSLRQLGNVRSMVASSYQAVSGAGVAGIAELEAQMTAYAKGEPLQNQAFPYQILCNLIPQIGPEQEDGYTAEEMKLHYEGRKILHLPQLNVSCTCVRVPVMRSHSISLRITFDRPIALEDARKLLENAPGCKLVDDLPNLRYPMPLDATARDLVLVGRLRRDLTDPCSLNLWCCGDQLRKGAATNAIQIAELLIR
jgi:aspartate-semialdehyde dehydrogenase